MGNAVDCNGTLTVKTATGSQAKEVGDSHELYVNFADTWSLDTSGDLTADLTGTVTIKWTLMD